MPIGPLALSQLRSRPKNAARRVIAWRIEINRDFGSERLTAELRFQVGPRPFDRDLTHLRIKVDALVRCAGMVPTLDGDIRQVLTPRTTRPDAPR